MVMRRRKSVFRAVRYFVFLLLLYLFQGLIFSHFKIFGYVPMLFPIAVVGAALYDNMTTAGVFALACGVLCDVAVGETAALFTVVFTLSALVISMLSVSVITRGLVSYCVLCVAMLLLTAFVQMFYLLFFVGADPGALVRTGLAQTLVSAVFMAPIYPAVRFLSRNDP